MARGTVPMRGKTMLNVLYAFEKQLPALLQDTVGWNSVYIDYHKPFVERVWRNYGEYRVSLHHIALCEEHTPLFHPHPWPSAMRIVAGEYEMGVGYTTGDVAPTIAAKIVMQAGNQYEMTNPHGWHYVRPLTPNTLSLMIAGKPWSRNVVKVEKPLHALSNQAVLNILSKFRLFYG